MLALLFLVMDADNVVAAIVGFMCNGSDQLLFQLLFTTIVYTWFRCCCYLNIPVNFHSARAQPEVLLKIASGCALFKNIMHFS